MIYLAAFFIAFVRVFCRAFQQLSVVNFKWVRVPFISYLMAAGDVFMWGAAAWLAVGEDWTGLILFAFLTGTGGWLGAFAAMKLHLTMEDE